jgi:hypothetical protein
MNLSDCSNYHEVLQRAKKYYGDDVILLASTRATKKYMIFNPHTNRFIHFGGMGYIDYTKYIQLYDKKTADLHRNRYLNRALNIQGDWKNDHYSANILSILLLWDYEPNSAGGKIFYKIDLK